MIDFAQAFKQPGYAHFKPKFGPFTRSVPDPNELYEAGCNGTPHGPLCTYDQCNVLHDDTKLDQRQMALVIDKEQLGILRKVPLKPESLSDDQLLLLPNRIYGFALRTRNWGR